MNATATFDIILLGSPCPSRCGTLFLFSSKVPSGTIIREAQLRASPLLGQIHHQPASNRHADWLQASRKRLWQRSRAILNTASTPHNENENRALGIWEQSVTHRRGTIRYSCLGVHLPSLQGSARNSVTNGARLSSSFAPPATPFFLAIVPTVGEQRRYAHCCSQDAPRQRAGILLYKYTRDLEFAVTPHHSLLCTREGEEQERGQNSCKAPLLEL